MTGASYTVGNGIKARAARAPGLIADLNLRAQQAVDETLAIYAERFRQFGRTVA